MGNCFSNDTKSMRSEILKKDKLDIIKQKTSASRYHQESEKTTHRRCLQNITDKVLVSRLHKELLQLNKKTDNPVKNWAKDMSRHFSKQNTQITN